MYNNIVIIISNPQKEYIETQILEGIKITNNIIITYSSASDIENFILSIINKYNYKNIFLIPTDITENIEYNPLINKNPNIFWNNILRISGVMSIYTNSIKLQNIPEWYLFLNGDEIPNGLSFCNFIQNNKLIDINSYLFNNNILLITSNLFKNDIEIYKNLMKNKERQEVAELLEVISNTSSDIFIKI